MHPYHQLPKIPGAPRRSKTKTNARSTNMETNIITGIADGPSHIIDAATRAESIGPNATTCQPIAGGATRQSHVAGQGGPVEPRFDLLMNNSVGLRRLAETFGEGAVKYGEKNWQKGLSESNLINHALAHLHQYLAGDRKEDHIAHLTWNFYTLMWMQEKRPDLMDITLPQKNEQE